MADFQTLQLRQSQWADAERLISRWGKFGHYEDDCTASFCRYKIALESPQAKLETLVFAEQRKHHFVFPTGSTFLALCEILGGRSATLKTTMVVQDGVVLRKAAVFIYNVPPGTYSREGYSLIAASGAKSQLIFDRGDFSDEGVFNGTNQLVDHPHYIVTMPNGCNYCFMARVGFALDTSEAEVRRLTTFNFDCLTRAAPCRYLEDIYPAAEEWHLYDGTFGGRPALAKRAAYWESKHPLACQVPIFVRGREVSQIASVTSLEESQERCSGAVIERAKVRVDGVLKGSTRLKSGDLIAVTSPAEGGSTPLEKENPLTPGKRFLLLGTGPEDAEQHFSLDRCFVLPDTPDTRVQLQKGMAANDSLRYPDRDPNFIPKW